MRSEPAIIVMRQYLRLVTLFNQAQKRRRGESLQ